MIACHSLISRTAPLCVTVSTPVLSCPSGPPAWHRRKRGTQNQAIGRSRGGLTTKILALVDALGNLSRFILMPGQRHDSVGVEPLITGIEFDALLADKAFYNDWLRTELDKRG